MYLIRMKDDVVYAKYQTNREKLLEGEREIDESLFHQIQIPCTLQVSDDGLVITPADPPETEMILGGQGIEFEPTDTEVLNTLLGVSENE